MERKKKLIYPAIWRWHFYAGIVIAPLLLVLAVTGGGYLFKHDIEDTLYADYYEVTPSGTPIAAQAQVDAALDEIDGSVMRFRPGESDVRSAEVGIATEQGESFTVFINPYNGEVLGTLNDGHRLMDRIEEIHGELMAGTAGDRIVELAAAGQSYSSSQACISGSQEREENCGGPFFRDSGRGPEYSFATCMRYRLCGGPAD